MSQAFVSAIAALSQSVTGSFGAGKGVPQANGAKRRTAGGPKGRRPAQLIEPLAFQLNALVNSGAGKGNRTPLASLEG
jgi:hypothetical protein